MTLRRIPETKSNTIVVDVVFVACKVRRGQATMTEKFANCFAPRQAQVPCCFERGIIIHWKNNDCSKCCSSFMLSYSFILNQKEAVPASFVYLYSLLLSGIREFLFPFRLSGCRAMLSWPGQILKNKINNAKLHIQSNSCLSHPQPPINLSV